MTRLPLALAFLFALGCSSSAKPSADGGDAGGLGICSNDTFRSSGNTTCADTFDAQVANAPSTGPNGGYVVSGPCGGYLVWLNDGMLYSFACVYDPTTKALAGAREITDTTIPCSGAGTTLPMECNQHASYATDGGSRG